MEIPTTEKPRLTNWVVECIAPSAQGKMHKCMQVTATSSFSNGLSGGDFASRNPRCKRSGFRTRADSFGDVTAGQQPSFGVAVERLFRVGRTCG